MTTHQFKQFYQTLKAQLPPPNLTILEMRVAFEKMMSSFPFSSNLSVTPIEFKHCTGAWVRPPKITSDKVLLFFHGGAYTAGSWQGHQDLIGRIATGSHLPVCAVNYRLAPEHHFPSDLNDALEAYDYLLKEGYKPSQIIACGTSAGGGLALALLLKLKELKKKLPRAAILLCPWVDLALDGESLITHDGQDLITYSRVALAVQLYLETRDPKDPFVSPLYGDLSHLPPLLIQVGTLEILWSEIELLAINAEKAGTNVTFEPYEGMFHTWQLFASKIPEGQQAIDSICNYINRL